MSETIDQNKINEDTQEENTMNENESETVIRGVVPIERIAQQLRVTTRTIRRWVKREQAGRKLSYLPMPLPVNPDDKPSDWYFRDAEITFLVDCHALERAYARAYR